MAPSTTLIDTGDTFRLRNDHETDDLVMQDPRLKNRTITIGPGKSALVSFELIRIWWGDPRARPNVFTKFSDSRERGWVNKREAEIARLGVQYGTYVADVVSLNDPEWPVGDPRRGNEAKRTPWPVTVSTEAGQKIVPCGLDLTSEAIYGVVQSESENLDDEVAYRQHLESRLDEMKEELRRLTGGQTSDDTEVDIPGQR